MCCPSEFEASPGDTPVCDHVDCHAATRGHWIRHVCTTVTGTCPATACLWSIRKCDQMTFWVIWDRSIMSKYIKEFIEHYVGHGLMIKTLVFISLTYDVNSVIITSPPAVLQVKCLLKSCHHKVQAIWQNGVVTVEIVTIVTRIPWRCQWAFCCVEHPTTIWRKINNKSLISQCVETKVITSFLLKNLMLQCVEK